MELENRASRNMAGGHSFGIPLENRGVVLSERSGSKGDEAGTLGLHNGKVSLRLSTRNRRFFRSAAPYRERYGCGRLRISGEQQRDAVPKKMGYYEEVRQENNFGRLQRVLLLCQSIGDIRLVTVSLKNSDFG